MPGFRSGNPLHILIAILVYGVFAIFALAVGLASFSSFSNFVVEIGRASCRERV